MGCKSPILNKERACRQSIDAQNQTTAPCERPSKAKHSTQMSQQSNQLPLSVKSGHSGGQSPSVSSDPPGGVTPAQQIASKALPAVAQLAIGPTTELTHSVSTPVLQNQSASTCQPDQITQKSASTEAVYAPAGMTSQAGVSDGVAADEGPDATNTSPNKSKTSSIN